MQCSDQDIVKALGELHEGFAIFDEIYEVLRASKALQDFDDNALHDFVVDVKLNVLPAVTSLNSQQYKVTEG